jgi:hypothetical protein
VQRVLTGLDDHPARGFTNRHSPAYLRWRLSRPHAQYVLHVGSDLVAISTADQRFGVRAAVILKLLPRGGRSGPISSRQMIAAVCRHHRAPYAVYGLERNDVPAYALQPRRLQPSPLYLILRTLSASRSRRLVLDTPGSWIMDVLRKCAADHVHPGPEDNRFPARPRGASRPTRRLFDSRRTADGVPVGRPPNRRQTRRRRSRWSQLGLHGWQRAARPDRTGRAA